MTDQREMPKYKCHKEVHALQIKEIIPEKNPDQSGNSDASSHGATIVPEEDGYAPFFVSPGFMMKHKPVVGGYYVVYEDGYKSFSPRAAFEAGYSRI